MDVNCIIDVNPMAMIIRFLLLFICFLNHSCQLWKMRMREILYMLETGERSELGGLDARSTSCHMMVLFQLDFLQNGPNAHRLASK